MVEEREEFEFDYQFLALTSSLKWFMADYFLSLSRLVGWLAG